MREPEEEGEFENGCHNWLADRLTMTVEHDYRNHLIMMSIFEGAKLDLNSPATQPWKNDPVFAAAYEQDARATVRACLLTSLKHKSAPLWEGGFALHRAALDESDIEEHTKVFESEETQTDLNHWLYRRYISWNLDQHQQKR